MTRKLGIEYLGAGKHGGPSIPDFPRDDSRPSPIGQAPYSVPRRYDLATLFAVSLAYALLFGLMRVADIPPQQMDEVPGGNHNGYLWRSIPNRPSNPMPEALYRSR